MPDEVEIPNPTATPIDCVKANIKKTVSTAHLFYVFFLAKFAPREIEATA